MWYYVLKFLRNSYTAQTCKPIHTHKHTHTNLELVNEFFRFEGYKIKISKLIVFLYINNEQS